MFTTTFRRQSGSFSVPQLSWLQERAHLLGVSVSDVVRRIVDDCRIEEQQRLAAHQARSEHGEKT